MANFHYDGKIGNIHGTANRNQTVIVVNTLLSQPKTNDEAVDKMCSSIREFGFKVPVLAKSDGTVIDGHLRLKAAHKLNLGEIPVILCDSWSDAQVKAFRLLVNRSVGWATWDEELLRLELADLKELAFDLSLSGFDPNR